MENTFRLIVTPDADEGKHDGEEPLGMKGCDDNQ